MKRFYEFMLPLVALVAMTASVTAQTTCQIKIVGEDSYADGWNDGSLAIVQGGTTVATFNAANADNDGEGPELDSTTVTVTAGIPVSFVWTSGMYDDEVTIWIYDGGGTMVFTVSYPTAGTIYTMNNPCPSCMPPTGLTASITGSDVDFSWTEGTGTSWQVAWGTGSFNPDTVTVNTDNTTSGSYTLYGPADGMYTFYVRTDCGGGDTSNWVSVPFNVGITVMNMAATGVDTLTTCNAVIYDDGGQNGAYSSNCQSTLIIRPSTPGDWISVSGSSYLESTYDYLTIYDGEGTNGEVLWTENGIDAQTNFGPFASDAITVAFHSDGSVTYSGFQINATCITGPSCFRPSSLAATNVAPDSVYLEWVDSLGSAWTVAYGPAGFTLGDTNTTYVDFYTTTGEIDGLNPNTSYDFYVMTLCAGDTSMSRMITVHTPCGYLDTLPYNYGFEGATTGSSSTSSAFAAPCWTRLNNGTSYGGYPYISSSSTYCHTGSRGLYWYNSTTTGSYGDYMCIVLPGVDPDYAAINTLQLKFWAKASSASYHPVFQVGVMSNPNDINSFVVVGTVNVEGTTWTQYETMLGTYTGTGRYVAIRTLRASSSWYAYMDDITLEMQPECPHPVDLVVDSITTSEVFIHWTAIGPESSWLVTVNDSIVGDATDTTYQITNLSLNTIYNISVSALCDNGDTSEAVTGMARTLAGDPINVFPYTCGFEVTSDGNQSTDWVLENGTQANYWTVGSATNNGGNNAMYITNNGTANSYTTGSISYVFAYAVFDFDSGEYAYSYDWKANGESSFDFIRAAVVPNSVEFTAGGYCGFNNTSGVPAGGIAIDGANRLNLQSSWNTQSGTFNIANSGLYKMVFMWRNDGSGGSQPPAAIDNITVIRNLCPSPQGLAVTTAGDTADFTWTNDANGSWELAYGPMGFTPDSASNIVSVSTNSYQVTGLTTGFYDAYLRSDCSGENSLWIGPVNFTIGITVMNMATSGTDTLYSCAAIIYDNGGPSGAYSSYCNSTLILLPDTPGSDIIVSGTSYTESSYDYITIYEGEGTGGTILWTDNGVSTQQNFGPFSSYAITITFVSDGSVTYSGFEINASCTAPAPCPRPTHFVCTSIAADSVAVEWNEPGSASNWQIVVGPAGFNPDTATNIIDLFDSSYVFTTLLPGVSYDIYVRSDCGSDTSLWTGPVNVTPGQYIIGTTGYASVNMCGGVIYDNGGPSGSYSNNVDYTLTVNPSHPDSIITFHGSAYTESSIDYLRIYEGVGTSGTLLWQTSSSSQLDSIPLCTSLSGPITLHFYTDGSVTYSGFELFVNCIAAPTCRAPHNLTASNITSSSATISWTPMSSETQWIVSVAGTNTVVTTPSYTVTGLTATTNYSATVRAICGIGDTSFASSTLVFTTTMCDNANMYTNYDSTASATSSSYSPIGYSLYDYSYTQIIIDSAVMSQFGGDITAFGFMPVDDDGADLFSNMDVYMANVSESNLSSGFIHPDSAHTFVQVISGGNFNFTSNDIDTWVYQSFDSPFIWDGHSNVLFAVNRLHGNWSSTNSFAAHNLSGNKMRYVYQDDTPYNINTVSGGTASSTVGDIMLVSCGGCSAPGIIGVTNIDYESATVTVSGNGESYELNYGTDPSNMPNTMTSTTGVFNITGLTSATQYFFQVRQECEEGEMSNWNAGFFVTDSLPCMSVTNLNVTATSYTSVTLNWTAGSTETAWEVMVYNNVDTIHNTTYTSNITVTGLTSNVTYNANVRPMCGGNHNVEGPWLDSVVSFTTDICRPVDGVTVTNVTGNSATINWNAAAVGSGNYRLEYGYTGFDRGQGQSATATGATSYTITGLESEVMYDVYVANICTESLTSTWSTVVTFETTNGGGSGEGIVDVDAEGNLSIYPNPASAMVSISVSDVMAGAEVTIVDLNGRTVSSFTLDGQTATFDVSTLAKGAYFVRLTGEQATTVRKLIVK